MENFIFFLLYPVNFIHLSIININFDTNVRIDFPNVEI